MKTRKELEIAVRENIQIDNIVAGITGVLRDHFDLNSDTYSEQIYNVDIEELMVNIGLLRVDKYYTGNKEYVWTKKSQELYKGLQK